MLTVAIPENRQISGSLDFGDRWDHFLSRIGYKRASHRVEPGLYSIGSPDSDSPVFVTSNYTLSFDSLRSALFGIDGYILVLNTRGINVWCAAGEGTFGTDELVRRIESSNLREIVNHRKLILPQLGAPGVSAQVVKKRSRFKVEYGPVRADDLPEYLIDRKATEKMRRVRFPLPDRAVLIPVELNHVLLPTILVAAILYLVQGPLLALGAVTAVLAGAALFPVLLYALPTKDFGSKGFLLGGLVSIPFIVEALLGDPQALLWGRIGWGTVYALAMPSVTAFLALNFTGATTFTSRTGVKREIKKYVPSMAYMFAGGLLLMAGLIIFDLWGIL